MVEINCCKTCLFSIPHGETKIICELDKSVRFEGEDGALYYDKTAIHNNEDFCEQWE